MDKIGEIEIKNFIKWCESMEDLLGKDPYKSGITRKVAVIGNGIDYLSNKKMVLFDGLKIKRVENFINRVEGWENWSLDYDLALLFKYEKGGGIKPHRDSTGYGKKAGIVSSCDYVFNHDGNDYDCVGGDIYEFESKVLHGVKKCNERWVLCWWMLDFDKFQQLSLF